MDEQRRCKAKSQQTGQRCKKAAMKGATVCRSHGGAASQVRKAGEQRELRERAIVEAQRMVQRAGVEMDPLEHLLDSLHVAFQLERVWGAMVAEIDRVAEEEAEANDVIRGELGYEHRFDVVVMPKDRLLAVNSRGEARVHPYMEEYQRAVERRAKFAKLCLDAGVAERQVRVIEQQVELAQQALEATLDSLGLEPSKRQEARRTYARHLRAVA